MLTMRRVSNFCSKGKIEYLLIVLVLCLTSPAYGLDVVLTWDANTETDLAGYRVFYREDGQSYDYNNPAWEGIQTTCTIYSLDDGTGYYFVARAFDTWGNESGDSDEVTYTVVGDVTPPELVKNRIPLKDLDHNTVTKDFSPSTNIRYRVKYTINGNPNRIYKVVVTGKAFSLYRPDGTNREWSDKFDNPTRKARKLYGGESKKITWNRQIPVDATPGKEARVRFTLKLKEFDEVSETWNLLQTYKWSKKFNIVP